MSLKSTSWNSPFLSTNISLFSTVSNTTILFTLILFWSSSSPSISLLCVVAFILEVGILVFLSNGIGILCFLFLILVMIGGLFVLFSFVILSYPNDLEIVSVSIGTISTAVILSSILWVLTGSWNTWTHPSSTPHEYFVAHVGSGSHEWALLSVLFFLLFFLFIIDSIVNHNGGTLFYPN